MPRSYPQRFGPQRAEQQCAEQLRTDRLRGSRRGLMLITGVAGAGLLLAGCVGVAGFGLSSLLGGGLLALLLLLQGCQWSNDDPCSENPLACNDEEHCIEYPVECVDGVPRYETRCCPANTICNYGWEISIEPDGSCTDNRNNTGTAGFGSELSDAGTMHVDGQTDAGDAQVAVADAQVDMADAEIEQDAGDAEECDGYIQQDCIDGVLVDVCCPEGLICNYGLGVNICADGSCVHIDPCPEAG